MSKRNKIDVAENCSVMTLPEAANYLRVSERTLWQLVQSGIVPSFRVGRQHRFLAEQLVAWARKQSSRQLDVAT